MNIQYIVKLSKRSRRVRIAIVGGRVVISAPYRFGKEYLDHVVAKHEAWINNAIRRHEKLIAGVRLEKDSFENKEFVGRAKDLVKAGYLKIAAPYGVKLSKLSIKKMRSRWGSCSGRGNVSINLLLGHLPEELLEYVIVHELCHLVHHNHSKRFWALVAAHSPDFKKQKMELRRYGHFLTNIQ
jgi:predicted metal-dependent hydrolase